MRRGALALALLIVLSGGSAFAQTANGTKTGNGVPLYGLGDQMFLINAGIMLPLYYFGTDGSFTSQTNLTVGPVGTLGWKTFLNNNLAVGIDLGGTFAFSPNGRTLVVVPVTGNVEWIFRFYPFEIPLSIGTGINFTKLDTQLYVGTILKPGVGFYWNITSKWAAGIVASYWFVPEIYFGTSPPASATRFGNFLDISLSALYHF